MVNVPLHSDPPAVESQLWEGVGGSLAFDVGANIGQSYLLFLKDRFARVECFEPHPESFDHLRKVKPRGCHNIAVSDHDGTVDLMEEGQGRGMLTCVVDGSAVSVPCRTLDSLAKEFGMPDFVKIDVEGHELAVVNGGYGVLRHASFLIEIHTRAIGEALREQYPDAEVIRHPHYETGSDEYLSHYWIKR